MIGFDHLYDTHRGETCVVIGNGPSLRDVPDAFLRKHPSFGANRIGMRFTPTYYVAINPLVIEQNLVEILNLDCKAKFLRVGMGFCDEFEYELRSMAMPLFSYNPSAYVYEGFTVTFVSLQLAFFMGFSTVLLVGVDHRYTYDGAPNAEAVMTHDDPNHFDPAYFKGQRWNNPDLERSAEAYMLAKVAFESECRHIINLTEGSALDVFERGELKRWQ